MNKPNHMASMLAQDLADSPFANLVWTMDTNAAPAPIPNEKLRYLYALLEAAETHAPTDQQLTDPAWITAHKAEALLRWVSLELLGVLSECEETGQKMGPRHQVEPDWCSTCCRYESGWPVCVRCGQGTSNRHIRPDHQ